MSTRVASPFDSIESAHDFVVLLEESIEEALAEVQDDFKEAKRTDNDRRAHALHLAMYKMSLLDTHIKKSRRLLNDLRTIRRLLFSERESETVRAVGA
ncbi:MAG: hypothetical protein ABL995_19605 [Bryobacteraceae bacterium]